MAIPIDGGGKKSKTTVPRVKTWPGTKAPTKAEQLWATIKTPTSVPTTAAAAKKAAPATNPYAPGTWEYSFFAAHNKIPTEQDARDREWSMQFLATYGRPPSEADWRARYNSRGGGGGGGNKEELTMGDIFTMLELPASRTMLPSYARSWFDYLAELLQGNLAFALPVPTLFGEGEEPTEKDEYAYMESAEQYAQEWQSFLDKLERLSFSEQQALQGWKYNPETGWSRTPAELLRHPEYL